MSKSNLHGQPKVRSHIAIAAHMRNSAGAMGGGKRTRNRRDRRASKQALRGEA
jgi:hypothetical protein